MDLGILLSVLATSVLFLQPIAATDEAFAPFLSPILKDVCDAAQCGRGTCKASANVSLVPYICECQPGWKQFHVEDHLRFLPCVIPICTLNYTCSKALAPPPSPPPTNHSILDSCTWSYCGEGTCVKTSTFGHECKCGDGYANLFNVSTFPCFTECALGADCINLGIGLSNQSSSTPPSLSDNGNAVNKACLGHTRSLFWPITSMISLAVVAWI